MGKDWKSLFIGVLRVFLQVPFYSAVPLEALLSLGSLQPLQEVFMHVKGVCQKMQGLGSQRPSLLILYSGFSLDQVEEN